MSWQREHGDCSEWFLARTRVHRTHVARLALWGEQVRGGRTVGGQSVSTWSVACGEGDREQVATQANSQDQQRTTGCPEVGSRH